jgi:DNA repair protein SbcD/Mre11
VTRLLCMGDLHLGAGASLGREPGSRLTDQDAVLKHILARAVENDVAAILVAGDTFDGPIVTPEQLDVFAAFVSAADDRDIPVVAISGNGVHDQAMRDVNAVNIFSHIPGVSVYSRPAVHDLSDVRIACLPWVSPRRLVAMTDGDIPRGQINNHAAGLMLKAAQGLLERDPREKPTVLLMHGSLSGASLPTGIATDDLNEPVIDTETLLGFGFGAVVAGHIHKRQILTGVEYEWDDISTHEAAPFPLAFYTGSPLPLNFGEASTDHGVWILDIDATGSRARFVPIESRPFRTLNLSEMEGRLYDTFDIADAIVRVTGTVDDELYRRIDFAAMRDGLLNAAGAHSVKFAIDKVRADRARVGVVTDDLSPLDAFDAWTAANSMVGAEAARERMQADLEEIAA